MSYELRTNLKMVDAQTINGTGLGYTSSGFDLSSSKAKKYAVWVQASGTTVNLKVTVEMSDRDTDTHYVVTDGQIPIIDNLTDSNPHVISCEVPDMKWIRFRVYGNAGNGTNTVLTLRMSITS